MKTCAKCGKSKSKSSFGKNQRYCKTCKHEYYLASRKKRIAQTTASKQRNRIKILADKYGVSEEVMRVFKQRNNGMCELCNKREATVVDHDHATGKLRGHLCPSCNKGIGFLGDTLESVLLAVAYLER